jgi:SSS family solute:Na+ symporter
LRRRVPHLRPVVLFPTFQLFLIPIFLIGFAGVLFPTAPPSSDFILPHMILETGLPALVVGLFCAGALSASMSTGDALLHGAASIAVEDGLRPFLGMEERRARLLMQVLVVAVGGLAYLLAVVLRANLVVLLLAAYGVVDQLAPPVYAALLWRRATTAGALAGLIGGTATTVFFFFFAELRPWDIHEGLLGLVVNVALLVGVSLATAPQQGEHSEAFVEPAGGSPATATRQAGVA